MQFDAQEVKLIRWALRIATNTVAKNAEDGTMPGAEAFEFIAILDALDEKLYDNVREDEKEIPAEQLTLF